MKKLFCLIGLILFLSQFQILFSKQINSDSLNLSQFVNPFIGTGGHGHTYPGVSAPFGMVQLSPDTRLTGWDGCSAYHYSDSIVYGFSHTHLSGTGCSDYGDILLMPTIGKYELNNEKYSSIFNHESEKAFPGYYSVFLEKNKIKVELTATKRTGFHRYTFPENKSSNILIDLKHRDEVLDSKIEIHNDTLVTGYRRSKAWAKDQIVYFAIMFSKPFLRSSIFSNDTMTNIPNVASGKNIKAYFSWETKKDDKVLVKVGISAVSVEGAMLNLTSEIPGWDFDFVTMQAKSNWNEELSKIVVEGGTRQDKVKFYTALYHCFLSPNLYSDVDGKYRGTDLKIHEIQNHDYYTVFSLWDTYRAFHPLMTIIDKKRTNDFINTFIKEYEYGGLLPVWELSANETFCMIGYHSVSVIADAFIKGIRDYDYKNAFEAMKLSATQNKFGLDSYRKMGFLSSDVENESVSKTLEYAYDDWCIAQMAKKLNEMNDYYEYIQRAQYYKNLFDTDLGFIRAKFNGGWYTPFDPTEVNNNYTEANCWQYTFYVPQDISGFMSLLGGKKNLEKKLDELFSISSKTTGREQSDISGLIGQYAHGNEPSHHIAYLYDYADTPWKTQEMARIILEELYTDKIDGLSGNEDCGQMSAWFVLSAIGLYSVCPGQLEYALSSPIFDKITINLENEKEFVITAKNSSEKNIYIQSAKLNGMDYNKCYLNYDSIMAGGILEFVMEAEPATNWGIGDENIPKTEIKDNLIVPVPYFMAEGKAFRNQMKIEIKSIAKDSKIFYTLDGKEPDSTSKMYQAPFEINNSTTIKAIAYYQEGKSFVVTAQYFKIPDGRTVKLLSKYNSQYTAGGPDGLIDNIRGKENWRLGGWQGYQGTDFEAIVDLGKVTRIHKISTDFLQDVNSWIWMPAQIEYSISNDTVNFKTVATIKNDISDTAKKVIIKNYDYKLNKQARYIRVKAKNYGQIPSWHEGKGEKAFIFLDEINVE